jgi:hypothetical protein
MEQEEDSDEDVVPENGYVDERLGSFNFEFEEPDSSDGKINKKKNRHQSTVQRRQSKV